MIAQCGVSEGQLTSERLYMTVSSLKQMNTEISILVGDTLFTSLSSSERRAILPSLCCNSPTNKSLSTWCSAYDESAFGVDGRRVSIDDSSGK